MPVGEQVAPYTSFFRRAGVYLPPLCLHKSFISAGGKADYFTL